MPYCSSPASSHAIVQPSYDLTLSPISCLNNVLPMRYLPVTVNCDVSMNLHKLDNEKSLIIVPADARFTTSEEGKQCRDPNIIVTVKKS